MAATPALFSNVRHHKATAWADEPLPNRARQARAQRGRVLHDRVIMRGRRRLRREVRVAMAACLLVSPLLLLRGVPSGTCAAGKLVPAGESQVPRLARASHANTTLPGDRATLSLEPVREELPDPQTPLLIRPAGFLLPDDGSEESAHAQSGC